MTIMTKMEDNNVVEGLHRTYENMDPCQYVREIYQNSVEAGATDIRFTLDKLAKKVLGVERGVGIDNGPGIPKDKIKDLINKKNSSSKNTNGPDQNFGVGLKVAALPRNQYGLIVMCRTKEQPKGFMIWLCYDFDHDGNLIAGTKALTSLEQWNDYNDGTISELVPNDLIDFQEIQDAHYDSFTFHGIDWMSWWDANSENETGTAVILCGNSNKGDENTFNHLIYEGKSFLQSRYLKYDVRPIFGRRSNTAKQNITHNTIYDPLSVLSEFYAETGTITFKSWKLHYFVRTKLEDHGGEKTTALIHKKFKEIILYKNELYGDYTSLHPLSIAAQRNSWGIFYKSVGDRVTLIIEPPIYNKRTGKGVYPNEARSQLSWKDSKDATPVQTIPLDKLKAYFIKNMPESIRQLIEDEHTLEMSEYKKSKVAEELNQWLSIPKDKRKSKSGEGLLIADPRGTLIGGLPTGDLFSNLKAGQSDSSSNSGNSKDKTKKEPTEEELKKKEEKRKAREQAEKKRQEPPTVTFHKQSEDQAEEWFKRNGQWQVAFYEEPGANGQGNLLRINQNHDCFWGYMNLVEDWLKAKGKKMHKAEIFQHIVRPFWEDYAPCKIQHAKTIQATKRDKDGFAPERLTFAFYGDIHFLKPLIHTYYKQFEKGNVGQC